MQCKFSLAMLYFNFIYTCNHKCFKISVLVTHRGSLKTFTLSDGRRINMIRPSWLEDGDRQIPASSGNKQEVLVDGAALVMSPVDSIQSKQILVVKTFRENAMDRFPSILKLTLVFNFLPHLLILH